jgi:hypothetical protein
MSDLDAYTHHPQWRAYRDANISKHAGCRGGMTPETLCLIAFAGEVDNGRLAAPAPTAAKAKRADGDFLTVGAAKKAFALTNKHLAALIGEACAPLNERIAALEKQLAELKAAPPVPAETDEDLRQRIAYIYDRLSAGTLMIYRGVYAAGETYRPGDTVTSSGSLWHCKAATMLKPGYTDESSRFWCLAAKRGRDGRDAPGYVGAKKDVAG